MVPQLASGVRAWGLDALMLRDDASHFNGPDVGPTRTDFLQDALVFRGWGWSVVPLGPDKRPAVGWKRWQSHRPTDKQIGRMFDQSSRVAGVAAITGGISGGKDWVLSCRDYDDLDSYRTWAAAHPDLAAGCPTALTPRPGAHVWCRLRGPELFVGLPDGELRAKRTHYVALPPSLHPSGRVYRWADRPDSLRDFPVLDLGETGFLPSGSIPSPREVPHSTFNTPTNTPSSPPKPPNGLCATSGVSGLPGAVREAVLRSLPRRAGERNARLLRLARSLADLRSGVPAAEWVQAVLCWWRLASAVIGTKPWAETWRDFCRAWSRGRVPISDSLPVRVMTEAAVIAGPEPSDRLLAACRSLAAVSPGGVFFLAGRLAAEVAGLPHRTAARLLAHLVDNGALALVESGQPGSTRRVASVYRLGQPNNLKEFHRAD